ncbi:MAG: hypothetical protein JWL85_464 [Candidatus Saccharibacteria bacterium]|nr:hypothetical protein [Candidatus Saccharibacteria bacterium]
MASPESEYDDSLIGPLSASRIGDAPVSWGVWPNFTYADAETGAYVEKEAARIRTAAKLILYEELKALMGEVSQGTEPRSVLHRLTVGTASIPEIAGECSLLVSEVERTMNALDALGILMPAGQDPFGESLYDINPDAVIAAA